MNCRRNPNFINDFLGEAGVWGVDANNQAYIREGVTESHPSGMQWKLLSSSALKQIDSGPRGIVYGVNRYNDVYCRLGITSDAPDGSGWKRVVGLLKYLSCNVLGCYGVNHLNQTFYRRGVNAENCEGNAWIRIYGLSMRQIEVS